jgi:hypothetical protein
MIDIRVLKLKIELERSYKELKLELKQKELVQYASYKLANAQDKSAKEKIIDSLKLADDAWLLQEEELLAKEGHLKIVNLVIDTLQGTIGAMSFHKEIDKDYFDKLQDDYLAFLESELLG